jgi:outer membrane lipoprotein-sorting protein
VNLFVRRASLSVLFTAFVALSALSSAQPVSTDIRSYVADKVDDFTAVMTVVSANQRELGKISRDFGLLYRFKDVTVSYKEPNRMRLEGSVEGTRGLFIINGTTQWVSVPKMNLRTRRDLGNSPGKKKSLMDVGLVSEFYLSYTNAQFLREATVEGVRCAVFRMTYKDRDEDSSHHIIYIDPKTRVVRRREAFSQEGKLQAIYFYREVREIRPGIWFPTRIEVQNTDRVIAGVTAYKDIKVNTGLSDNIFRL